MSKHCSIRSIDSNWDQNDIIFVDETKDIVPIIVENEGNKYTVQISQKKIDEKMVFSSMVKIFDGCIKLILPDSDDEIFYGWSLKGKIHNENGPAIIKFNKDRVIVVQWWLNGEFVDNLACLERIGSSLRFFYRANKGKEKFQIIRTPDSSNSIDNAPDSLKEIVHKNFDLSFNEWDKVLESYHPNAVD